MSFKSFIRKLKPVGKFLNKNIVKPAASVVKKVGKFAGRSLDNVNQLQKNATNLISPSNIILYVGGFIAVVYLAPKILNSEAAKNVSARI
jgi:hypothetical protein